MTVAIAAALAASICQIRCQGDRQLKFVLPADAVPGKDRYFVLSLLLLLLLLSLSSSLLLFVVVVVVVVAAVVVVLVLVLVLVLDLDVLDVLVFFLFRWSAGLDAT